jgi:hypothetical protein
LFYSQKAGRKHRIQDKMELINFNRNPTYFSEGEEAPSRPKIPKRKFSDTDINFLEIPSHAAVNKLRAEDAFEQRNIPDQMPRSLQQAGTDMMDIDQEDNPAPEDLLLEPRFAIVVSGYDQTMDSGELVCISLLSKLSLKENSL